MAASYCSVQGQVIGGFDSCDYRWEIEIHVSRGGGRAWLLAPMIETTHERRRAIQPVWRAIVLEAQQ